MISEQDVQRATAASAQFRPAILSAKYHGDTDCVELETPWCILIVDRQRIAEPRTLLDFSARAASRRFWPGAPSVPDGACGSGSVGPVSLSASPCRPIALHPHL